MRQRFAGCALGLGLLVAAGLGYLGLRQASGNFGVVVAGEVYRAAQPDAARLRAYAAEYGLRGILNLRGADPDAAWYRTERATAADLGIEMIDLRLSASRALDRGQFDTLVEVLRTAPKPLLIHCRSGADRTGLAAVIYLALIAGVDEETAEAQLSLAYGHPAIPWLSAAWPMDVTWERIEAWSGIEGS